MTCSKIVATGAYVPKKILTNQYFESILDTSDEWIQQRTGIQERRHVVPGEEATSDMALHASKQAIERAGWDPATIDLIVVATSSPDYQSPTAASLLGFKLGATKAFAFDLAAACAGSVYALHTADSLLRANEKYKRILVVGSEIISNGINWKDRNTAVLFGDGAGAALLEKSDLEGGFIDFELRTDGSGAQDLLIPIGGSLQPITSENVEDPERYVRMNGREVYKKAVTSLIESSAILLKRTQTHPSQISHVLAHQANLRIVETVAKKLEIPLEKWTITIDKYGNTSAASLFLSWNEAMADGRIKSGDKILMMAIGAGFTWGGGLYQA